MKIQAFYPKILISEDNLTPTLSPYIIVEVHLEEKIFMLIIWQLAHILKCGCHNAAPNQQWALPMSITPQVAPKANQACETS